MQHVKDFIVGLCIISAGTFGGIMLDIFVVGRLGVLSDSINSPVLGGFLGLFGIILAVAIPIVALRESLSIENRVSGKFFWLTDLFNRFMTHGAADGRAKNMIRGILGKIK
ncbi:MAG: hypothetical protein ACYDBP_07155 [Leptospirales bacterium]